jgi:hypothetical protein
MSLEFRVHSIRHRQDNEASRVAHPVVLLFEDNGLTNRLAKMEYLILLSGFFELVEKTAVSDVV